MNALLGFLCKWRQNQIPKLNRPVVALQLERTRLTFIRIVRDPGQPIDHASLVQLHPIEDPS